MMDSMNPGEIFWTVVPSAASGITTVRLIACECPGIFSKAVGVLSLNRFNILNAKSYREKDRSYHIFEIQPLPGPLSEKQRLEAAHQNLLAVLDGRLDLSAQMSRQRFETVSSQTAAEVSVNNDRSTLFSVVEVRCQDFPGLLFAVTNEFFKHGIHIWKAEISTEKGIVNDAFYVKDSMGLKLTSIHKMSVLKTAIETVLSSPIVRTGADTAALSINGRRK